MSNIIRNDRVFVSINEAQEMILSAASAESVNTTFLLLGEPGIAKTAVAMDVARIASAQDGIERRLVYIDCPTADIADLGVPVPDPDTKTTRLYPNELFGFHEMGPDADGYTGVPGVIVLDEFSKGSLPVQNMLHPLLNPVGGYRRLGAQLLHPKTIVILTGNLGSDGVGDNIKAHTRNRVTEIHVRKATVEEYLAYAMGAGINPMLGAWLSQDPRPFRSYLDPGAGDYDAETLMMIHNPTAKSDNKNMAVCTPRSFMMASDILNAAEGSGLSEKLIEAQLIGTIGATATRVFMAFRSIGQHLPSPAQIVADPLGAPVPENIAAQIILGFKAPAWMTQGVGGLPVPKSRMDVVARIDAYFKYIARMVPEQQAVFVNCVKHAKDNAEKQNKTTDMSKLWGVMITTKSFQQWAINNSFMF